VAVVAVAIVYAGSSATLAKGVRIDGVDVGGMSTAQATRTLQRRAHATLAQPVQFLAAGHTFNIVGITETADGFDEERAWARDFWSALAPHHTSVYVNFLMEEGQERVRQAYGAAKYDRLRALKRRYDPDNLFRLNQNIPPG